VSLTEAQQEHLDDLLAAFDRAARAKYLQGQIEHGGNVWLKPGMLREAQAEVIDQWVYLHALERQLRAHVPGLAAYVMGECERTSPQGDGCGE